MTLKEYPSFKRGELLQYYDKKLSKSEKGIIELFLRKATATAGERRVDEYKRVLTQFRYIVKKDFDKITLEDTREFLALLNRSDRTRSTKNDIKATIKRFLKWRFKDWWERFDELSDFKLKFGVNEKKINKGTLLSKQDVEKIMREEKKLFWKTFFITLYESGLRPCELRELKWQQVDLNVDGKASEIHVFATKTSKARSVFVKEATGYLRKMKDLRNRDADLIFHAKIDIHKPMNRGWVSDWLKRLSKRAIGREVNPYLLRHTRATELYINSKIPDSIVQKFLGHSKSMKDVYTHLSSDDVRDAMDKNVYNFDEEIPEKMKHELELKVEELTKELSNRITREEMMEMIKQAGDQTIKATMEEHKRKTKNSKSAIEILNA